MAPTAGRAHDWRITSRSETPMRKLLLATPLLLAALPAAAQQTNWNGPNLIVNGATANGCNVEVFEASHFGTANNSIRIGIVNRGTVAVRVFAQVVLTGPQGTKSNGEFSIAMFPNVGAVSNRAGTPFEGSLAGTRLTLNIARCVPT
ncbi:hypothetical protein KTR66_02100 [Roseococcus sp. SDR]|uniref:hypothetical protein n=1 Tax=Roseococcus sp. SDR TaxID=2835532 RepID=UPI001BCAAADA|nr:hypothetical protein [Roseococcus sp. SDR]MBS7788767.1 hypothetical protein [Roseococcus sp. SDR]MBV1844081.1 hypothetical protein [Roseococcus sp. SDR]